MKFQRFVLCIFILFIILSALYLYKNVYLNSVDKVSVMDTLRLNANRNGKVNILALGSSVTIGGGASSLSATWVWLLDAYIKQELKRETLTYTVGHGGFSTTDILSKVDNVINLKPDIVLFETCIINDAQRNIPLKITISNIDQMIQKLQEGLPHTRIIIQSPNPIENNDRNTEGLTYQDYVEATKAHIVSKGWEYVDICSSFNKQRLSNGLELRDTLYDGYHPNDIGYRYWFNTLKDYFTNGYS